MTRGIQRLIRLKSFLERVSYEDINCCISTVCPAVEIPARKLVTNHFRCRSNLVGECPTAGDTQVTRSWSEKLKKSKALKKFQSDLVNPALKDILQSLNGMSRINIARFPKPDKRIFLWDEDSWTLEPVVEYNFTQTKAMRCDPLINLTNTSKHHSSYIFNFTMFTYVQFALLELFHKTLAGLTQYSLFYILYVCN